MDAGMVEHRSICAGSELWPGRRLASHCALR